jgi:hypothetical protein
MAAQELRLEQQLAAMAVTVQEAHLRFVFSRPLGAPLVTNFNVGYKQSDHDCMLLYGTRVCCLLQLG